MLNRIRDFVKRLELPQEDDVVYRIIDDQRNSREVSQSQFARWSLQNDVALKAVVGEDSIDGVKVRTTFSIMPENRSYKPFGTSAFDMTLLDPLTNYSRRYDTWEEAEQGHQQVLEQIRRDFARDRAVEERAKALAGVAGGVQLAISADLPALFHVNDRAENEISVQTPLSRPDGSPIVLTVVANGSVFDMSAPIEVTPNSSILTLGRLRSEQVYRVCEALGVSLEEGFLTCRVDDASHLAQAILGLAQAVVCTANIARERR